mmetsp:Transcript_1888/g.4813  ORF Transcript_1888/g.4813 Transcript_1888/m.4813 type:complete len:210 (+) Transcript_1888:60-689(+)
MATAGKQYVAAAPAQYVAPAPAARATPMVPKTVGTVPPAPPVIVSKGAAPGVMPAATSVQIRGTPATATTLLPQAKPRYTPAAAGATYAVKAPMPTPTYSAPAPTYTASAPSTYTAPAPATYKVAATPSAPVSSFTSYTGATTSSFGVPSPVAAAAPAAYNMVALTAAQEADGAACSIGTLTGMQAQPLMPPAHVVEAVTLTGNENITY